jgi:ribonucleoside-triphosphate reductase
MTAIQQLELWKTYALNWCEHKPSVTISVRDEEWVDVGAWVYRNFDICSGISFLPHSDHTYQQAPYQDCDKAAYDEMLGRMPVTINWGRLGEYESDDNTSGMQTLACTGGVCEIVDLTK